MSRRRREKGKINVVNLSNYTSPEIKVTKDKAWVTYGTKNEYFSYLLIDIQGVQQTMRLSTEYRR